jgi:carbamate kinase
MPSSILIAVGGNSLIRAGQRGTIDEQRENARITAECIADVAAQGHRLIVTHGNGPQVGSLLLRSEAAAAQTYTVPLDICVAMTQGEIGFTLQSMLSAALRRRKITRPVVCIVTQVVVDPNDPAFSRPTKPVGPFYSKEVAEQKRRDLSWNIIEDAARGYRRVVPSPLPKEIVEIDVIRDLMDRETIVIAVGGGGIPVVAEKNGYRGIEAVIDKDRASALLAARLGFEQLVISTEIEQVYINFKKPNQMALSTITASLAKTYLGEGHFSEGSMKPKIEAALEFLAAGGTRVTITDPEHVAAALNGTAGTRITHEGAR